MLSDFGITISEAGLAGMAISGGIDLNENLSSDNMEAVEIALCNFLPSLLVRPASVSEGSVSFSFDKDSVIAYYSFLCKKYGIKNIINPTPTVTFY